MAETGAGASAAPTEIENLVLLSANVVSAFPKWSPTVVKEEHDGDIITGAARLHFPVKHSACLSALWITRTCARAGR